MHTSTLTQGVDPQLNSGHHLSHSIRPTRPTFAVACWLLGLVGFVELITVGAALAVRAPGSDPTVSDSMLTTSRSATTEIEGEPITPRTIEQILAGVGSGALEGGAGMAGMKSEHAPVRIQPSVGTQASLPLLSLAVSPQHAHAQNQGGQELSVIANPRVERLVQEARNLHLEGDVMRAMLKLDEAGRIDSTECAVIYQKGLLFEDMGTYTRAADQYQQIQQMGLMKAGAYFSLAANKLTKGMDTASVRREAIAIGPMKVNKGAGVGAGSHVEVAVTLLARPDQIIRSEEVEVQVHFYDKVNGGEIKKAAANATISPYWSDTKVDWRDVGNEETLRVSYSIPEANQADEYLLGRREFYGYVVELLYKGEVVDQQACPRRLNSIHGQASAPAYPNDFGMPWLPEDDNSLLPGKDATFNDYEPLPSR